MAQNLILCLAHFDKSLRVVDVRGLLWNNAVEDRAEPPLNFVEAVGVFHIDRIDHVKHVHRRMERLRNPDRVGSTASGRGRETGGVENATEW